MRDGFRVFDADTHFQPSVETIVPALLIGSPSTRTLPAMSSALARSRLETRPRVTLSLSMRSFAAIYPRSTAFS